jgi:hypothetical protein
MIGIIIEVTQSICIICLLLFAWSLDRDLSGTTRRLSRHTSEIHGDTFVGGC